MVKTPKGLIESKATIDFAISDDKVGFKMPANKTNLTEKLNFSKVILKENDESSIRFEQILTVLPNP